MPPPSGRDSSPSVLASPEAVLSTLTRDGTRRWMYPVPSPGKFLDRRKLVAWVLILLYLLLPVLRIGGRPAVLLDFIHRQFALFGIVFYPTDTILLMLFLIGILLTVVIGTALLGRVWCGWACPQTVYLEFLFRPVERLIEGPEHVRKRRNSGPLTFDKVWRKVTKICIFLVFSLVLAHTFVAYFVGWTVLLQWIQGAPVGHIGFFVMMALTTGLILFNFGFFREQMCTITCPYARMQSVLLDVDSLIVSYDTTRGEPRSKRSKKKLGEEAAGIIPAQGDCIDCGACVRTCPTGIDIRDGLQMECITCTQCIDACDSIMDRIGKPRGLVRYTSENELAGKSTRILRPRTLIYSVLLLAVFSVFTIALTSRSNFDINVGRSVGDPFTVLPDGRIANRLRFRIRNQTADDATFWITALEPSDAEIRMVGVNDVPLAPGEMKHVESWVIIPPEAFTSDSVEGRFRIDFSNTENTELTFVLLGPSQ